MRLERSIPDLPDICDVPPRIVLPVIDRADDGGKRRDIAFTGWAVLNASTRDDELRRESRVLSKFFLDQLPTRITQEARRRYASYLSGAEVELAHEDFSDELIQARERFLKNAGCRTGASWNRRQRGVSELYGELGRTSFEEWPRSSRQTFAAKGLRRFVLVTLAFGKKAFPNPRRTEHAQHMRKI